MLAALRVSIHQDHFHYAYWLGRGFHFGYAVLQVVELNTAGMYYQGCP